MTTPFILTGHPTTPADRPLSEYFTCQEYGCRQPADGTLHAPDGRMIPAGFYCRQHGVAPVEEYAEKLGQSWTFRPFDPPEGLNRSTA